MRKVIALFIVLPFVVGCACEGPAVSKSTMGNVEINLYNPSDARVWQADIFVDGFFIGNANLNKPVLYLKKGERDVRVELAGCAPYDRKLTVLGDPNHQVLNIYLKPEVTEKEPAKEP